MFGLREAGVLGASVAVAGGVAYFIWNYASSSGEKKPETRPGEGGEGKGEEKRGEAEQPAVVAAAAAPVVAAKPPRAPEVKVHRTHLHRREPAALSAS